MSKTIFEKFEYDSRTAEVTKSITIKKKVKNTEAFIQAYVNDIGVLLKCTKGQIDFIICCIKLNYIEFDTNELVITSIRRKEIAKEADIKVSSTYNFMNTLEKKRILIVKEGKTYLNPKLFFYGSEIERERMLTLSINYEICDEC